MTLLVIGLVIFLGVHSVRMVANDWRTAQIARIGEGPWKGLYSLASAVGLVLIIWGYGAARASPTILWNPPEWTKQLTIVLTLVAFVLIAAAYVPGTRMKAWLGHPMVAGVKVWALAHLIANGTLAAVILFGSILVWAIMDFAVSRRRDRAAGVAYPAGTLAGDAIAVFVGVIAWVIFAFFLHGWLIGVRPLG
ncbi:MAG: hypothetical protein E6H67_07330 [Betaproteobacteria bacterium]|nr:MAG: hypothetical protein E6H74_01295 [Betaproteobacteria bacterium]TMH05979.1 MAG: hypothetical protein E6H67_07330 [Betaproteobacteria bacterium]